MGLSSAIIAELPAIAQTYPRSSVKIMELHGRTKWCEIERALANKPSCPKLESYWHFYDCKYHKTSSTCAEPEHVAHCPLPTHVPNAQGRRVRCVRHQAHRGYRSRRALLAKAGEHRAAHPELTEAQAFAEIYTAPANIELAKRERAENAQR